MTATTANGVPYPEASDANDLSAHMQTLAEWIDANNVRDGAPVASGTLQGQWPNLTIKSGGVGEVHLASSAVTNAKLANGAVSGSKIPNFGIKTAHLEAAAVTRDKLANGAVVVDDIAGGAWTPYTPVWSSLTAGAPDLADGALVGRYTRMGRMIHGNVFLGLGATTALGAGQWAFSAPTPIATGTQFPVGQALARSNSGAYTPGITVVQSSTALAVLLDTAFAAAGTPPAPYWEAGSALRFAFTYESA